jgi:hypothetical protein
MASLMNPPLSQEAFEKKTEEYYLTVDHIIHFTNSDNVHLGACGAPLLPPPENAKVFGQCQACLLMAIHGEK